MLSTRDREFLSFALQIHNQTIIYEKIKIDYGYRFSTVIFSIFFLLKVIFPNRKSCELKSNTAIIFTQNQKKIISNLLEVNIIDYTFNLRNFIKLANYQNFVDAYSFTRESPEYNKRYFKILKAVVYSEALGLGNRHSNHRILLCNDHAVEAVYMRLKMQAVGVKVGYLQHANITERFPRLAFDKLFLFSKRSKDIYLKKGPVSADIIVGTDLRLTNLKVSDRTKTNKVLIILTKVDSIKVATNLELRLRSLGYNVSISVHPADRRLLAQKLKFSSIPLLENLAWADIVIAGRTTAIVEAAAVRLPVIYIGSYLLDKKFQTNKVFDLMVSGLLKKEYYGNEIIAAVRKGWNSVDVNEIDYHVGDRKSKGDFLAKIQEWLAG
jgi:hypothetical protein